MNMKTLTLACMVILFLTGCAKPKTNLSQHPVVVENSEGEMLSVDAVPIGSHSFVVLKMNSESAYLTMADSILPNINDSAIALCVEAAFTGKLLKDFKTTNVAGDYVIDGIFHKGYECKANTGFLYADKTIFTIASSAHCSEWIGKAQKDRGMLFQQMLLIQQGNDVYAGTPIKKRSQNIYRAACILNDGNFAVIQSLARLPLGDFIQSLITIGVSDALYLDMGRGWNYGWYRPSPEASPVELFDYRTPYQTNWLVIRKR